MIIDRYKYQALSRAQVDGKRLYATPDGNKLPSVTTILDKTKSKEKQEALNQWRKRVGVQKAQQITTEAANRGTRMHTYLEHYVEHDEMKPRASNPFSWMSHDMAQTIIREGMEGQVDEIWGSEVPLYFPQMYAGTTDLVGVHKGAPAIMDFKQSNKPKKEEWIDDYKLQLAAYALAHNEVYGTKIRKGVVLMCVRPTEAENQPGVYVKQPQYQEFVIEGAEFDLWCNEWWKRLEQYYVMALA